MRYSFLSILDVYIAYRSVTLCKICLTPSLLNSVRVENTKLRGLPMKTFFHLPVSDSVY